MAKRALLIGINRYHIPGSDLRGCVNDVENIRGVLTKYYGFKNADMGALTDVKATTKRLRSEIGKLLKGAKRGDVLLLHYSGHGSNVPDDDGDEAEHRDEIVCPADMNWEDPLRDDWLRKTFDTLPAKVNLTVIMDCCHSGTITREIRRPGETTINRYLPDPRDIRAVESRAALSGELTSRRRARRVRKPQRKDFVETNIPEMLFTGCRDDQTSADAYISGSYNGALTYHLVKAMTKKRGKLSNRELHSMTTELLRGKYEQVPQLECQATAADLPFLAPIE